MADPEKNLNHASAGSPQERLLSEIPRPHTTIVKVPFFRAGERAVVVIDNTVALRYIKDPKKKGQMVLAVDREFSIPILFEKENEIGTKRERGKSDLKGEAGEIRSREWVLGPLTRKEKFQGESPRCYVGSDYSFEALRMSSPEFIFRLRSARVPNIRIIQTDMQTRELLKSLQRRDFVAPAASRTRRRG